MWHSWISDRSDKSNIGVGYGNQFNGFSHLIMPNAPKEVFIASQKPLSNYDICMFQRAARQISSKARQIGQMGSPVACWQEGQPRSQAAGTGAAATCSAAEETTTQVPVPHEDSADLWVCILL